MLDKKGRFWLLHGGCTQEHEHTASWEMKRWKVMEYKTNASHHYGPTRNETPSTPTQLARSQCNETAMMCDVIESDDVWCRHLQFLRIKARMNHCSIQVLPDQLSLSAQRCQANKATALKISWLTFRHCPWAATVNPQPWYSRKWKSKEKSHKVGNTVVPSKMIFLQMEFFLPMNETSWLDWEFHIVAELDKRTPIFFSIASWNCKPNHQLAG